MGSGVSAGNTGIACTTLGVPKDSVEFRCLQAALPKCLAGPTEPLA